MRMGDSEGPHGADLQGEEPLQSPPSGSVPHICPSAVSCPGPSLSSFLLLCWLALLLHLILSLTVWVYLCLHPCTSPGGSRICGPFAAYKGTLEKEWQIDPVQGPGRCNHSH